MSDTITPEKLRVMSADWSLGPGELRNALDDAADRIETLEAVRIALNKVIDTSPDAKLRDEELQRKYAEIVQLKDKLVRLELEVASLNKERQAVKEGNKYD